MENCMIEEPIRDEDLIPMEDEEPTPDWWDLTLQAAKSLRNARQCEGRRYMVEANLRAAMRQIEVALDKLNPATDEVCPI